ncbi:MULTISPECIES: DUF167 family protein [Phenylobacterium]|uniref:UPF0235 protein ABID41_001543 n=1 Tax=Phenylobacterium koreense TaxID=266125 RepID=A0ABV2EHD7_9CAUL
MRLAVRVTPKGGRDAIDGWALDANGRPHLKVRVSVAPTEGAANAAVIAFLAKQLGRPKSALRIVSGETSRLKMVEIEGLDEAEAEAVLGPRPAG